MGILARIYVASESLHGVTKWSARCDQCGPSGTHFSSKVKAVNYGNRHARAAHYQQAVIISPAGSTRKR